MLRCCRILRRATSIAVIVLALPVAVEAQNLGPRWLLAYPGGPDTTKYTVSDWVRSLAVVDTAGSPVAWLFHGIILLSIRAPSGRALASWMAHPRANGSDWEAYLQALFGPDGAMHRVVAARDSITRVLGPPPKPLALSVMIPYPDPRSDSLRLGDRWYSTRRVDGVAALAAAYIRMAASAYRGGKFPGLSLESFYWLNESVRGQDAAVVRAVARVVHHAGYQFYWIPYFHAPGWNRWRAMGFDLAWVQPNYFFHPDVPAVRLDTAAVEARSQGMGLEIEFNSRLFTQPRPFFGRLDPYLKKIEHDRAARRGSIAVYDGAGALAKLSAETARRYRALYCRLVTVLRGPTAGCH